jgi:preprotein translocase subunit SecE
VARDRKRAKQRRDRRAARATGRGPGSAAREGARATPPSQLDDGRSTGAETPGALEHASADVDEFEAAVLRGAEGVAAEPQPGLEDGLGSAEADAPAGERPPADEAVPAEEEADEEREPAGDELDSAAAGGRGGAGIRDAGAVGSGDERARPAGAPLRGRGRAVAFLQASWAELQRVQWPDRRQTTQATAVVLGFVVVAGAYLGAADFVANEIVEFVLG